MKNLFAVLTVSLLLGATGAEAFDVQKGRWIGYVKTQGRIIELARFDMDDRKEFKGYTFTNTGFVLRLTGNVNDGVRSKAWCRLTRRGHGFTDYVKARISGRPSRFGLGFEIRGAKARLEAFHLGGGVRTAGAYEGFNSFGQSVLMIVLPDGQVRMTFTGLDFDLQLKGRATSRSFTVDNKDGTVSVKVTISGDGRNFRGEGLNGNQAFRVFGKTLPESPEDIEKD